MSWAAAQPWCNFVLLEPQELPADLEVRETTMRPEAPPGRPNSMDQSHCPNWTQSNRSAHRCLVVGENRSLRIKQFLYDYAPPAFDHPCLWESPRVEPFEVGNHIGWCGVDYHKRAGATVSLHRTNVEFSVLSGNFRKEEFQWMCQALAPVDVNASRRIAATSLAELSYRRRHQEPPIAVPVGYLSHQRSEQSSVVALTPEEVTDAILDWLPSIPSDLGFRFDSAFLLGSMEDPDEVDFVLTDERDGGRYLRILVSPSVSPVGVPFPPRLEERQRSQVRTLELAGRKVVHAFAAADYGQHEAVWQTGGHTVMLIAKPQRWTSMDWFVGLLEAVVA